MSTIGEIIESRRKELGLTLEDVGNAVGVSKSTVKKWETGYIANMRRDRILSLSKVLDINPNVLIDYSEQDNYSFDKFLKDVDFSRKYMMKVLKKWYNSESEIEIAYETIVGLLALNGKGLKIAKDFIDVITKQEEYITIKSDE